MSYSTKEMSLRSAVLNARNKLIKRYTQSPAFDAFRSALEEVILSEMPRPSRIADRDHQLQVASKLCYIAGLEKALELAMAAQDSVVDEE